MLGRISGVRHATVVGAIGSLTALTGFGVIGAGDHPERFETFHVVVAPAGPDGLRVTETFDHDFGSAQRHGPERYIPNDFGAPIDVVASSPDAPDDVSVAELGSETRVRIGDPDVEVSGQHRYTLSYTLPSAQLGSGLLALDIIEGDQFETLDATVFVTGFELAEPDCFVGASGSTNRCELVRDGAIYRADLGPLSPYTGVTIEGRIVAVGEPSDVPVPPIPPRRSDDRLGVTLGMAAAGLVGAAPVYAWARRKGRNEVFAGGAADAAHGPLPPPARAAGAEGAPPPVPVTLVADDDLAELATIEFAPPKGLEPWEAAALLFERVDDSTVEAWLSGLAGREVIAIGDQDGKLTIGTGEQRSTASDADNALVAQLLGGKNPYVTGTYDPAFAKAWGAVLTMQRERIRASGWWKHGSPGDAGVGKGTAGLTVLIPITFIVLTRIGGGVLEVLRLWPVAIALGLIVPAAVAYGAYRRMLPARSAQGSALALRTESFRRFLHASEGQHVDWAWSKGLLRQYSGWAVALGEADAWAKALAGSNVPAPARRSMGPIIAARSRPSVTASRTKPSSSSGGGSRGGGSRGGRVGGGGGGGSRGSW
jgi:uncharacterized membrane protein YgcG